MKPSPYEVDLLIAHYRTEICRWMGESPEMLEKAERGLALWLQYKDRGSD